MAGHGCSCVDGQPKSPNDCPYMDPALVDPHLTELGEQQAVANRPKAHALALRKVYVSPLRRALKTALLGFDNHDGSQVTYKALELAREQLGLHHCDQRTTKSTLATEFPSVEWPIDMADSDGLWTEVRESKAALVERALATLRVLAVDESPRLALVTHSSFLKAMFAVAMDFEACGTHEDQNRLSQWFETGELRTLVVNFTPLL